MNEFTIIEIIIGAIIISIILVIVKWGMMRCKKADPISIKRNLCEFVLTEIPT